eukprot:8164-Heterococcus_DN1.PRE.29
MLLILSITPVQLHLRALDVVVSSYVTVASCMLCRAAHDDCAAFRRAVIYGRVDGSYRASLRHSRLFGA